MNARQQAQRAARRARHAVALARLGSHEILSVNDDFTDHVTDIPRLARKRRPLAIGGQETKGINYHQRMPDGWGVRQRLTSDATAGVMVAWDKDRARAIGNAKDQPARVGHGWVPLVEPRDGDPMLTRGVVWQDLQVRGYGDEFRLASTHRPPRYLAHLWTEFDRNLRRWLEASPIPVVLCMDANDVGGPGFIDDPWQWRGRGIDGVITNLRVTSAFELDQRRSDHQPVSHAVRTGQRRVWP